MKLLTFIFSFIFSYTSLLNSQITTCPVDLRCDFWQNPNGIDVPNPILSWTIQTNSEVRAMHQTAYQIIVSSSLDNLKKDQGDLWNSGKVQSDNMGQIIYDGKPLLSSQQCWWKVKIWGEKGIESSWSQPSQWTMGILNASNCEAQWITEIGAEKYAHSYSTSREDFAGSRRLPETWAYMPKPGDKNYSSMLLRKEFDIAPQLQRAVIHVSGLGHYELSLNGNKVGDYLLSPGWTDYNKTILYDTYDVTSFLKTGNNAVGLILSNGMYNIMPDSFRYVKFLNSYGQLRAIAQLRLEYADGTIKTISTDTTWQVAPGPVTYMNEYGGEDFDARLLPEGWNNPSFKVDNYWSQAIEYIGKSGKLKGLSCAAPPIKAIDTLTPIKITQLKANLWTYDLGQNASIMPQISVKGPRGSYVRIIPSELLKPDGTVDRRSATQDGVRPAWWQYTKATNQSESWFPQFFYQGGRYLQVELFPAKGDTILPVIDNLNGKVVHSSAEPIGSFACSNDLFNRIYTLVRWAQRSNMMSVLTDCPHREKMPWLEQYHLNGPSLRYNFDLLTLFRKGENDMFNSQLDNGFVPNIAPEFFYAGSLDFKKNGFRNSPEWGSSFIIVPWQQYLFSGDISLIRRYYEPMKRYIAFLDSSTKNNILNIGLGDWYDIGPKAPWGSQLTPVAFTATAIYFYDYLILGRMAKLSGKNDDAAKFAQKAETIRQSFNKEFFKPEKGRYATGSNTTMAMPLFLNIVEPQYRKSLIDTLVYDIRKRGNSFTSGDVGYRFLIKALAMEGFSDVIFDMNNQTERPGYGYQIKKGATSLTEKWDAGVGSFGSQNHFMLGQINEWFFNNLLGLGVNEDGTGAGFRNFIIKPMPVGDITWVKGSYRSVSGLISVDWKRENHIFVLNITIPANTSATVYIPALKEKDVFESGKSASKGTGIKFLRMENDKAVYYVGSGEYKFKSKIPIN